MPIYTIKKGDTLNAIAAKFGTNLPSLIQANPQIKNPDLIYPGGTVNVPEGPAAPSVDSSARSLPPMRSLDQAGGGAPVRSLPDATVSPLLRFSSVVDTAVGLAKKKRDAATEALYGTVAPKGALPATSLANFMSPSNASAENFTAPLVKTAVDTFKTSLDDQKSNKDKVRAIAEKVALSGGTEADVQSILSLSDPEAALIKATPFLGSGNTTAPGKKYSTPQKQQLSQAGLAEIADERVKDFFLNSPAAFQDYITRQQATGTKTAYDIVTIGAALDAWQKEQDAKSKKKVTNPFAD